MKTKYHPWKMTQRDLYLSCRADETLSGKELAGCEVCWTCGYFSINGINGSCSSPKDQYNSVVLIDSRPDLFRCAYWKELDD